MQSVSFKIYNFLILKHPMASMVCVLVLAVGLAAGIGNFKIDASADSLTLEHDDALTYFREMVSRYGSTDFLIVTFSPLKGDLFDDANLNTLKSMRDALAAVKGVAKVTSMLDVPLLYSPKISVSDLKGNLRTLLSPGVDRQMAKQEFLTNPIYRKLLLGPDGQTTGMLVTLNLDVDYLTMVQRRDALRLKRDTKGLSDSEWLELERVSAEFLDYRTNKAAEDHKRVAEVRALIKGYKDRARIYLGGPDMITADMIDFIKSDLAIFGSGIALFIVIILAVIFRQLRWVILPFFNCALCLVMMLGFLSWVDWRLTVISSNFVSLLLIITLAINIHLIVRYRELHTENRDASQYDLVLGMVRSMAKPCLYTVLTTIVAFASLVVSDIRPVIDFGWMMTIGISLALVLTFVVLPAGLMIIGKNDADDSADNFAGFTVRFAALTEKHGKLIIVVSVLLAVASAYGISKLQVENRFIDYFHSNTEIYRGMEEIDASLGGTTPLDIILEAPAFAGPAEYTAPPNDYGLSDDPYADANEDSQVQADDPFAEPETDAEDPFAEEDSNSEDDPFADETADTTDAGNKKLIDTYWFTSTGLADLQKLQDFLDAQPEIGKVSSLVQLKEVAGDLMGHRLNDFEIAFLRKSLSNEIYQLLVAPYLLEERNETRFQLRAKETGGLLRRAELLDKIRDFAVNEVGIPKQNIHFSGLLVLYNNMLQSLYRSQILTLGAVFIGIMLMFMVLFRSWKFSVIAILPNILAAGVVLGSMGLFGIPLDMMTITIAAITVGIGVDDTIHYIHRFKHEFEQDHDYIATMYRAHGSIGHAMYYTSVIIIAGFSILTLSNFIPSVYFGVLTGVAMFAALMGALALLPKLILMIKPLGKDAPRAR